MQVATVITENGIYVFFKKYNYLRLFITRTLGTCDEAIKYLIFLFSC